jgi:large subunit ribosomal protein L18
VNHQRYLDRQRARRAFRVRKRVRGTLERPRLSVFRSLQHIYAQVIDDAGGRTLVAASSAEPALRPELSYGGNRGAAEKVGQVVAERALAAGIKQVCFDRGSAKYHGRVSALAGAARAAGLSF